MDVGQLIVYMYMHVNTNIQTLRGGGGDSHEGGSSPSWPYAEKTLYDLILLIVQ